MKINIGEFKDKVHACWIGKNIGGTIGGPYEGAKQMLDVKGFSTPANVVLPNDDLDLQLIWMEAVKRVGPKNINATVLGEFWISYVTPYWNEYGRCKNNMIMGLVPPLSGDAFNEWKHSNGAWIRTEIWLALHPDSLILHYDMLMKMPLLTTVWERELFLQFSPLHYKVRLLWKMM